MPLVRSMDKDLNEPPIVLRGRTFNAEDLAVIRRCIDAHFDRGRTFISQVICEELGWKQPNGWLKDRACRDVLIRLERMGVVTLPPTLVPRKPQSQKPRPTSLSSAYDITPVTDFPANITLEFAKGNDAEKVWNEVVDRHHYLGHKIAVGRCIKYLVRTETTLLGAVAFSSPAWRIEARDRLLRRLGINAADLRDKVINNSRFLILPNVRVPNLASRVLALTTTRIVKDWTDYYCLVPQVAETFIQPSLYNGTCYKAANWVEVGATKGFMKSGGVHRNSQEPKHVLLYGLNRRMRRNLLTTAAGSGSIIQDC
jgi:hypothetical protein